MAHLMKANRNQVGGLTRHFERYKKENGVLHNSNYVKPTKNETFKNRRYVKIL